MAKGHMSTIYSVLRILSTRTSLTDCQIDGGHLLESHLIVLQCSDFEKCYDCSSPEV